MQGWPRIAVGDRGDGLRPVVRALAGGTRFRLSVGDPATIGPARCAGKDTTPVMPNTCWTCR